MDGINILLEIAQVISGDSLHGEVMLPMYKQTLDTLDEEYTDVIYSRFDLMPIHDNKLYIFVGKGKDVPKVPPIDDSPLFKYSSQGPNCTENCRSVLFYIVNSCVQYEV